MKRWKQSVLCVLVISSWGQPRIDASVPPPVSYVKSEQMGNMFISEGKSVQDKNIFLTVSSQTKCGCQTACWAHPECSSVSMTPVSNVFKCSLAKHSPLGIKLNDDPESHYTYWENKLEGTVIGFGQDRLLYFLLGKSLNYHGSKKVCESMPGFQFGIYNTLVHYNVFKDLASTYGTTGPGVRLYLYRNRIGKLKWGDKRPVDPEVLLAINSDEIENGEVVMNSSYVMTSQGNLLEIEKSDKATTICQANPLGVDW